MNNLDKKDWVYDSGPIKIDANQAQWLSNEYVVNNLTEYNEYVKNDPKELALNDNKVIANKMTICNDNEALVEIDTTTGEVTFGENYTLDETSRIFWKSLSLSNPRMKDLNDLNMYRNLYKDMVEILGKVRSNLGIPEGKDIIAFTKKHGDECNWHKWDHRFSFSDSDCTCKVEMMDFTQPSSEELAQGKGSKVEKLPVPSYIKSWHGKTIPLGEDVRYFEDKLARAKENNLPTARIEKQLELLKDGAAIYHGRQPSEVEIFDNAMKVIEHV